MNLLFPIIQKILKFYRYYSDIILKLIIFSNLFIHQNFYK